jgi:YVTN family beta-propeller protein
MVFKAGSIVILAVMLAAALQPAEVAGETPRYVSPVAVVEGDGRLYVAGATAHAVLEVDPDTGEMNTLASLPEAPNGLVFDPVTDFLYVTCDSPAGRVCVVDTARREVVEQWLSGGHTPCGPQLAADGLLAVCNRFSGTVSLMDTVSGAVTATIGVGREPVASALGSDGRELWVAHLLPDGPADGPSMAAVVSLVDLAERRVAARVGLPNGSTSLRGIALSPDGAHAYVTHIVSRFQLPTTQVARGWMNTNALSVIDTRARTRKGTVLLDELDRGAANPWGVACAPDGKTLCVGLSGTHELALIDLPALHARLADAPGGFENDLTFLDGVRRRVALPGNGPRGVMVTGGRAYAAEYFSDSLAVLELDEEAGERVSRIALGPDQPQTDRRLGERHFHDAALCFQQWQSCATCHPDARVDALNWDLLNDGIGNPKNTRSMLLSHQTPPVMGHGVRATAEVAVRAGIKFIQFATRPEEDAAAIDAYLRALEPVPGPWLENGELGEAARRGEMLFNDETVGCAVCHPGPHYTDLQLHDVGTRGSLDYPLAEFDTPTLVEVWRTAPYLHDGRSATMREVLREHNPEDRHGVTSHLTDQEINDLAAYIMSL